MLVIDLLVLIQLPASEFDALIFPRHRPHGKHFSSVLLECVFIGPLPSNGCPSNVETVTPGMCLWSRCLAVVAYVTIVIYVAPR
jgi:hypothetical protein